MMKEKDVGKDEIVVLIVMIISHAITLKKLTILYFGLNMRNFLSAENHKQKLRSNLFNK